MPARDHEQGTPPDVTAGITCTHCFLYLFNNTTPAVFLYSPRSLHTTCMHVMRFFLAKDGIEGANCIAITATVKRSRRKYFYFAETFFGSMHT